MISKILPIGKEMKKMMADVSYLRTILDKGAELAQKEANKNLLEIKNIIGLN